MSGDLSMEGLVLSDTTCSAQMVSPLSGNPLPLSDTNCFVPCGLSSFEFSSGERVHCPATATSKLSLKMGELSRKHQQKTCVNCLTVTPHVVSTHYVKCDDGKGGIKSTFAINKCCRCNAEYSACRKCCQEAEKKSAADHTAALSRTYKWTRNEAAVTKRSLTCGKCKQKYIRCNGCQALYKHYWGKKGHRTKENCRFLKFLKMINPQKKKTRSGGATSGDRHKVPRNGPGPDSIGAGGAEKPNAPASPTNPDLPASAPKTIPTSPTRASQGNMFVAKKITPTTTIADELEAKANNLIEEANRKARQLVREARQNAEQLRKWAKELRSQSNQVLSSNAAASVGSQR